MKRRFLMIKNIVRTVFLLALLSLSACGDGSSTPAVTYTTATLKISLSGVLPAGKTIAGTTFTLTLPANVTPAMTSGAVAASVVTPSGTFAGSSISPIATYNPAVGAASGTMPIVLASSLPAGVTTVGEVATIVLQLANGAAPAASNFALSSLIVSDTGGAAIAGMTASVLGVVLK
jgi:hypothetical protein